MNIGRSRVTLIISIIALIVAGASMLDRVPGAGAAAPKQPSQPLSKDHVLRVVGTSRILVAPNEAYVLLGVTGRDKGAQTAMSQTGSRTTATLAAIKSLGVSGDSIHLASAGLIYDSDHQSYQSGTLFTIELDDVDVGKAGPIVDAAVKAGATKCASVYFDVSADSPANEQALHAALANARKQAESLAGATGVKITGVDSIDQANYGYGYPGGPGYKYGPQPYGGPPPQPLSCGAPIQGPPGGFGLASPQVAVTASVAVVYTIE